MFKRFLPIFATFSVLSAGSPEIPPAMQTTWVLFQKSLKNQSPESLAKISKFPIRSNEFGGTIKSPAILKARFKTIFTAKTIQCLLGTTIKRQTSGKKVFFEAFCDNDVYPIRYVFEQVGLDYKFTSIDNINE